MSSSAQHHNTFCTLDEVERPQIFSMASFSAVAPAIIMEPPFQRKPDVPHHYAVRGGNCRAVGNLARDRAGKPARRSGHQELEEFRQMRPAGANGVPRLHSGGKRETRRQAEGMS